MSSAEVVALLAVADELYAVPTTRFTADRDAAAKGADDKELARRIKALRKPSTAAWAVNLLVRRESDQIGQVLDLAESLRAAAEAMDGDELRSLTRQRRQLTSALTSTARALAREYDVRLTGAVADQVEGVLNAAMLDPVAADAVRTGLLVTSFAATGVSELDVAAVLAVPEALGSTATPTDPPAAADSGPPGLHVVPDTDEVRRARAQDAVDRAAAALAAAEAEAAEVDRAVADLGARSLQVQDEIDELRRRLEEREAEADRIEGEAEEAGEAQQDAADALDQARREHDAAVRALAKLS